LAKRKMSSDRRSNIIGMLVASFILIVGVPGAVWLGNGYNALLSTEHDYSQIENVTAFKSAEYVDGIATKGRIASMSSAGANLSEETAVWDGTLDWDTVILTTASTDAILVMNINKTPNSVLRSDISGLRIKTNCTIKLEFKVYAVKWDGTKLTKVLAWTDHVANGSQVKTWNVTPMEILNLNSDLNEDADDITWIQVVITGYSTAKITTGSTIQFQMAWETPDNPFVIRSYTMLQSVGVLLLVVLTVMAVIASPWVNIQSISDSMKKRRA
jgi:hypothetical protein